MNENTTTTTGSAEGSGGAKVFNADAHVEKLEATSEKDMMFDFAHDQVQRFVSALEQGNLPCQPRENTKEGSYADTFAAKNVIWDNTYKGMNQFMLKIDQREKGYKTGDYLTAESAKNAYDFYGKRYGISMDNVPFLKKDAASVVIFTADKGMQKFIPLHNIESFGEQQPIREFAAHLREQKQERNKEYFKSQGKEYHEASKGGHDKGVLVCKSTDPVAVLGQWEAAVSTGKGFKITPEQNAAFVASCKQYIDQPQENGQPNRAYRLQKLMSEAGKYCKEFIPTIFKKNPERAMSSPVPEMSR